jgi:hypothetical protein
MLFWINQLIRRYASYMLSGGIWRLSLFSWCFSLSSVTLLFLTLQLPWQTYTAQNTNQQLFWNFADCYVQPTGINDGTVTVCDPVAPARLVYACMIVDFLSLLLLLGCLLRSLPPYVPYATAMALVPGSSDAIRTMIACRCLALLRVAHLAMSVGAMMAKNRSLPANAWTVHEMGWSCLAGAIACSTFALIGQLALCYREIWEASKDTVIEHEAEGEEGGGGKAPLTAAQQPPAAKAASSRRAGSPTSAQRAGKAAPFSVPLSSSARRQEFVRSLGLPEGQRSGARAPRLPLDAPGLPAELLRRQ